MLKHTATGSVDKKDGAIEGKDLAVENKDNEARPTSYPELDWTPIDATQPSDSTIAGDFETLSAAEQEEQRCEWKADLSKTEEEISIPYQIIAQYIYFVFFNVWLQRYQKNMLQLLFKENEEQI